MNTWENMSVEEEINRLSEQIQSMLDNLDNIREEDIDPELLALAKAAIENNKHNQRTPREIAEKFFPPEI